VVRRCSHWCYCSAEIANFLASGGKTIKGEQGPDSDISGLEKIFSQLYFIFVATRFMGRDGFENWCAAASMA
jgi:hypothetical protein